jgi:predicted RNA-binding Zn ribbon-like protein
MVDQHDGADDGVRGEFLWVGNHPATDLCNTEPVVAGRPVDLLPDAAAVVRWVQAAGIPARDRDRGDRVPATAGRAAAATVRFVHRLRAATRALLESRAATPALVAELNAALAEEAAVLHVDPYAADPVGLAVPGRDPDRQLRLDIAVAVADIARHDHRRVRRCANPDCVLLFLDVSKGGQRRWCDMATCGNRAKTAAHQARAHLP